MFCRREKRVEDLMVLPESCWVIPAEATVKEAVLLLRRLIGQFAARTVPALVVLEDGVPAGLLGSKELLSAARLPLPEKTTYGGWSLNVTEEPPSYSGLFAQRAREMACRKVRQLMRPFPACLKPADTLSRAAYLMSRYGLEILPVVENGRVLGFLRERELLLELARLAGHE